MQPKISVIVPVYKAEKYLHRCVDSILTQSFSDFELILVNDGSPDNSGAICDEYAKKDNRVRVFHKENGGVASARNLGLDNALGEWITFIDADDYIEKGFLNIPDCTKEDLLIQNYIFEGDRNKIKRFEKSTIQEDRILGFINENIHEEWLRAPWAKFFKGEIIKNNNIKFPIDIKIGEDTVFVLDYLYYTKSVHFISSANYVYLFDTNWANKYTLSAEKSIETFHLFIEKFKRLNAVSIPFLRFSFMFYWCLISPRNYNSIKSWQRDRIVKEIYKTIQHEFDKTWKIKYRLLPLQAKLKQIYGK